ncbi:molybdenum cofactor biosynthesis protein MoaE [Fulvivirga sediminis]|uniref:Molybdopterin synthase catalytic subunit n=1 Tax=Fulvivirga sediminis TaxID=2803949 RepID=A0A937K1L9_9BACT|nr:molybdenum cofactor biosynthesis protein MoaE [Fulvivirga sediminis]MBL3657475.1 molybdenum cofactor biosynthesis protein MoaE [Fulvivirga sediminis]
MIKITELPLSPEDVMSTVYDNDAGAVNVYVGTAKVYNQDKKVVRLEYEVDIDQAIEVIEKIIEEMKDKWPVHHVTIHHRSGVLTLGEVEVVIAVSAIEAKESFAACEYAVEALRKADVIKKNEIYAEGEELHK